MTQDPEQRPLNELPQVYDSAFKEWISQQAPAIVPLLLPGATYEQTLTIELIRPTMRMDNVFKMVYHEQEHILHLEFQTGFDKQLVARLLVYNAGLYYDHHLPVITIAVYPFKVTIAVPPLSIKSGKDEILTFRFKILPLFELDAENFVREHHTAMYPLLPTMQNVHAHLIDQAMQELAELYHDDTVTLAQQFVWLQLLLERTGTIPDLEKEQIKRRLTMFEQLFNESPMIQKMREQSKVEMLQHTLVDFVGVRFPDLTDFAQKQTKLLNNLDQLEALTHKLFAASDAIMARRLLESVPEQPL